MSAHEHDGHCPDHGNPEAHLDQVVEMVVARRDAIVASGGEAGFDHMTEVVMPQMIEELNGHHGVDPLTFEFQHGMLTAMQIMAECPMLPELIINMLGTAIMEATAALRLRQKSGQSSSLSHEAIADPTERAQLDEFNSIIERLNQDHPTDPGYL